MFVTDLSRIFLVLRTSPTGFVTPIFVVTIQSLFIINSFKVLLKMADDERRTSKRSRFDQTESDVRRSSRFDRDSRSPVSRHAYTRQRSRSPIAPKSTSTTNEEKRSPAVDPAAAAGNEYTCQIGTLTARANILV